MNDEPFTPEDLVQAVDDLSMLPYFPHEARSSVIALLARMCPHRRALKWLVNEVVNHVNRWPGPAELRGLLCTRFEPRDGVDQWCSLPGYTAEEAYEKHLEQHYQLTKANGYLAEESKQILQIRRKLDENRTTSVSKTRRKTPSV